jgi:hypothetical protein
VVAAGEVVAEAHRRVRADEHRAGVDEVLRARVLEVQFEVLRRVGVAERRRAARSSTRTIADCGPSRAARARIPLRVASTRSSTAARTAVARSSTT